METQFEANPSKKKTKEENRMIHLSFSKTDLEELRDQRFHHPHPHVQRKMEALLLKSCDLPHHQIARIVGSCPNTLRSYFREYQQAGVSRLKEIHFHSPTSALASVRATLESSFRQNPPATIKEAAMRIEQRTGIKRGLTQVRRFLKSLGMKRRKTGSLPAKADAQKQNDFKQHQLEPRLQEARAGKRVVYFVDVRAAA
ncbi:MAG: winged helix-turn-helix domain-containing protein [Verrucomicrobia bacterium]|nr:winged helix-turn-helix domain-containing protein [Verrucomicrobiota bacterium]